MQSVLVAKAELKQGKEGEVSFFFLFHLFQDTKLRLSLQEGQVPLRQTMPGGSRPCVCDS